MYQSILRTIPWGIGLVLCTAIGCAPGWSTTTDIATSRAALGAAAPVGKTASSLLSPMGARARRALRALTTAPAPPSLRAVPAFSGEGDEGGDDEGGGPGEFDDGGELPGGNQGELSIAVDDSGQNVVIGFNDFRGFAVSPLSVSGFMWSDDGGRILHDGGQLPVSAPIDVGGTLLPQVFGDPDVKYLGDCNFIYSSIILAPFGETSEAQTMGFHRSRDCGHTWEGPFEIASATNPSGVLIGTDPQDAADKEFMDVDRATGRVLMSWTNFSAGVEISSTYSDNVLGPEPTWSPRVILGNREVDGQGSMPHFGVPGSGAVFVAWWTGLANGNEGISVVRSNDNGATFSTPVDLVPDGFFPIDQILGNDRVHSFPSITVDRSEGPHRGEVYVAYAENDAGDGADVVVQASTDGGASFGAPVFVTSRPGADRAQWFPSMTTDARTGRALLFYYDQGVADSGDLTQSSFTFSDDGALSWAAPRRLSPSPFHAGWGNTTSQPNLGDYNQGVVGPRGNLLAAYAITHAVGFFDGEPASANMTVPEPIVTDKSLADQVAVTTVDLRGVSARELHKGSDRNGFLDAGETAAVSISVRNYVTNPMSARTIDGAVAVVHSTTPGVRTLFGITAFPTLRPGETKAAIAPVFLALDPTFVPGQDITLAIQVFSLNGLPVDLEGTVHTGTPIETLLVSENFDEVDPGALPASWSSVHGGPTVPTQNVVPWITTNTFCGTPSNAAFHINADDGVNPATDNARWERLTSPTFTVPADADYVTVDLDVCTDTEDDPDYNIQAYDGVFLRLTDVTPGDVLRSVLVEAFQTDFTTDGSYGYPKHLPRSSNLNYFQDMSAWAGDSGGIRHVKLRLAGMAGASAQLRFEFTQDRIDACAVVRPGHSCGVLVDNIVVKSVKARR